MNPLVQPTTKFIQKLNFVPQAKTFISVKGFYFVQKVGELN